MRLDDTAKLRLELVITSLDVVFVNAATAVIDKDGPEAELIGVKCSGGCSKILHYPQK